MVTYCPNEVKFWPDEIPIISGWIQIGPDDQEPYLIRMNGQEMGPGSLWGQKM